MNEPSVFPVPIDLRAEMFPAGFNAALRRQISVGTQTTNLVAAPSILDRWKPGMRKPRTFGLTFPEGMDFAPEKETPGKSDSELRPLPNPVGNGKEPRKTTRIKPPKDALSIEDRLFYVLQPPLETWLRGQELVLPFEPFPHQYEGIAWLFSMESALLADEMGLGKTMQCITAVRLLLRAGRVRRVLIVCPKPLIPNWQREFRFWADELPVTTVEGDGNRRRMIWEMNAPIRLCNYELMVRDLGEYTDEDRPGFDLIVLDEAQRIKNTNSRTAEVARSIKTHRAWALTGTPIENHAGEMVSLYEFLQILPQDSSPDLRQLARLSDRYVLRRTKDIALKDMPPRFDRDALIDLAPAQRIAYQTAEDEGVMRLEAMESEISIQNVFELILRLKQICNFDPLTGESSKLERLVADMEEVAASGGQAILFSQWTKTLDWLAERLQQFQPLIYHGGIPSKKRQPILDRFKEDRSHQILLMSYATGAVGLNLQFAGYVFLYDRWWNPAVEEQAINRAHRIGCTSDKVIVTKFICEETIEERIDKVLRAKRELFHEVLGDSNTNASAGLEAGDIFGLFDLKAKDGKGTRAIQPHAA